MCDRAIGPMSLSNKLVMQMSDLQSCLGRPPVFYLWDPLPLSKTWLCLLGTFENNFAQNLFLW